MLVTTTGVQRKTAHLPLPFQVTLMLKGVNLRHIGICSGGDILKWPFLFQKCLCFLTDMSSANWFCRETA